jgi:ubiquinone/menaquinone biosynthesis C-methylase UbiE
VFWIYDHLLYKKLGRFYDALFGLDSRYVKGHEKVLEGLQSCSILDVGCGTGTLLALAKKKAMECHGIDLSQGMLDCARKKVPDANLRVGDFENIPYNDNTFDYVVATNAIGSVKVNPSQVLAEMIRVCKPGGEIRLADYAEPQRRSLLQKVIILLFRLLGDTPYDYRGILETLGYESYTESLGFLDTYQYLRVRK